MRYFLKRCGFQELGSVGEDGKVKRGRYLMSSQNEDVVNFFPPLSIEIPNDTALLPIIPLYSQVKTYCSYVYHNSKYTGTKAKHPRNEYRIYLNAELEMHQLYFTAEDIVVFRKGLCSSFTQEGEEEEFYYIDVIKDHFSGEYMMLNRIIESYPINGGYGIFDGELDFFEKQVKNFEDSQFSADIQIDKSVTDRIEKATTTDSVKNIFNTATFRDFVLAGYANSCAITGEKSDSVLGEGIDVVYIQPRSEGGSCLPSNGIALCKELSMAFVQGKFTLSDNYEVIVHPENDNRLVERFNMQQIRVPSNTFFQPSKDSVMYHRKNVYGLFTQSTGDVPNERY